MNNESEINIEHDYSLDKIFLDELGSLLGYSTRTSVKNWCEKNKVEVYSYGNKRFILKYDYNNAIHAPQIKQFKEKYGANWEKAFKLAQKNELYKLTESIEPISIHHNNRYTPKSKVAQKLFNSTT